MAHFSLTLLSLCLVSMAGCTDSSPVSDAGPQLDAGPGTDVGPGTDAGMDAGTDAGPGMDAGSDSGPTIDVGTPLWEPMNHRPDHGMMCDDERDSPPVTPGPIEGCTSHEECSEGENGRCLAGRAGNSCSYDTCFSDDDCTGPCICGTGTGANSCRGGGCQIDSDCGPLSWCSPTFGSCGTFGGVVAYECHTPDDECTDDADCFFEAGPNAYCTFSNEVSHWVCDTTQCDG